MSKRFRVSSTGSGKTHAFFAMVKMGRELSKREQVMKRRAARILTVLALFLLDGTWHAGTSWEYALLNDFHFSVREELSGETEFQIDNYYDMDVYQLWGTADFHSAFLVTNDLNLLDREAVQLTLAYLNFDSLWGRCNMRAGRQFFVDTFDAFLGDGLFVEYKISPLVQVSMHFAVPFNAESEAIDDEPMFIYGLGLETSGWGRNSLIPFKLSASVERRDRTDVEGLDQTLLGFEALAELSSTIGSDLFAALQYETEAGQMRGMRFGSRLYFSPMLICLLDVERYDPDTREFEEQVTQFLSDAIVNYFSGSAVWRGGAALSYSLQRGRDVSVSYSGQTYDRRSGEGNFGQGVDCFFTFLSVPSMAASVGAGYSGRIVEADSIHLGVLRASAIPAPRMKMSFLCESGMLDTRSWDNEFVLHLRALLEYSPWPNLSISSGLEGNRNPYFKHDIRGMLFVRYFWAERVKK
jgi:hypothetical protein